MEDYEKRLRSGLEDCFRDVLDKNRSEIIRSVIVQYKIHNGIEVTECDYISFDIAKAVRDMFFAKFGIDISPQG